LLLVAVETPMEDRQAALFVSALEPSRAYAGLAVARNVGFFLVAVAIVPALAALEPWAPLVAAPLLGLSMYRLTLVMHDCIHGTLFRSARANRVCGIVMGALSGIEFHAFARLHGMHHRMAGQRDDPQGPDYLSLPPSPMGIVWHLLRPLVGYNLFKLSQVIRGAERIDLSSHDAPGGIDVGHCCSGLCGLGGEQRPGRLVASACSRRLGRDLRLVLRAAPRICRTRRNA
jgi:hypothetical protein